MRQAKQWALRWAPGRPAVRITARVACAVAAAFGGGRAGSPGAFATPPFPPGDGARTIVVLANRDDDDRDGVPDADDERVNGPADERDLALLEFTFGEPGIVAVRVSAGDAPLRFFTRGPEGWRHAGLREASIAVSSGPDGEATATLHVESAAWAGLPAGWDGVARVVAEGLDAAGKVVAAARAECRVAPVLVRPATARAAEVFVATGRYDNEPFVAALRAALVPLDVPLAVHPAADWREMWMQDTMEIATASIPGSRMHVVLAGLRGADGFPPTLLGPDTAVARVAEPRGLDGGDAWADWYGNLEVSPPLAAHPEGRAIHGRNIRSGASFHPEVVRFLAAQRAQAPLWIDTSWLAIKHVDEIVAFLPGPDGRGVVLVADPDEGLRLAGRAARPADGADPVEANRRIAGIIDAILDGATGPPRAGTFDAAGVGGAAVAGEAAGDGDGPRDADASAAPGLLDLLGWDRGRVVRLPLAFHVAQAGMDADGGVAGAAAQWSSPVNALFVNGTVICGACDMPVPVREVCRERFRAAGARDVVFIDDGAYHRRGGNVHCATNARRE